MDLSCAKSAVVEALSSAVGGLVEMGAVTPRCSISFARKSQRRSGALGATGAGLTAAQDLTAFLLELRMAGLLEANLTRAALIRLSADLEFITRAVLEQETAKQRRRRALADR